MPYCTAWHAATGRGYFGTNLFKSFPSRHEFKVFNTLSVGIVALGGILTNFMK